MRHRKGRKKLGRTTSHRQSMVSNMLISFIKAGRVETTEVKSKFLKQEFEKTMSLAIRGETADYREILTRVKDREAFKMLTRKLVPRFKEKQGGYCRIIKTRQRRGDAAPMALVEILNE
ncbi:MAG TPA: 50S ribosomal protein L17 [Atribacteraceae bacterium]|nr:50S ribosomal protein L17 [Atribacteraceae bacterium]